MDALHTHKERVGSPTIPILPLIQFISSLLGVPVIGVPDCVLCRAGGTPETPHPVLDSVVVLARKHRHPLSRSAKTVLGLVLFVLVATVDMTPSARVSAAMTLPALVPAAMTLGALVLAAMTLGALVLAAMTLSTLMLVAMTLSTLMLVAMTPGST
jgi:hypothetical protein